MKNPHAGLVTYDKHSRPLATTNVFDPAYKPKDAAKYCGCSVDTLLRRGVRRDRIHISKDGKHDRYVYRRSVLNAFIRQEKMRDVS